jgi:hypothetical protein
VLRSFFGAIRQQQKLKAVNIEEVMAYRAFIREKARHLLKIRIYDNNST